MNKILIFLIINFIFAEDKPKVKIGATVELLESRFVRDSDRTKTNPYLFLTYKSFQTSFEQRGERALGGFEFKNDYFYFSAGHRFKPIQGFYILRDEKFYSAFQNPTGGIIPQPLKRSIWFGINLNSWSVGGFMGKDISEKNLSFYFNSPKDIFSYTYSPETKIHFSNLNFRDYKLKENLFLTLTGQGIGTRENFSGFFTSKFFLPKSGIELETLNYREPNTQAFVTSRDDIRNGNQARGNLIKLSRYHYDRLEFFQMNLDGKIEKLFGANTSILSGKWGAICTSGRIYEKREKDFLSTEALGVSYEYRFLSTEFMLRYEERKNKDALGELKFTVRPIPEWRFEISSLVQKENNQFRSMYEQWSDGENIHTIMTDRAYAFKIKVIGNFVVFNLSGSRRKNQSGEVYFANIQFKQEF